MSTVGTPTTLRPRSLKDFYIAYRAVVRAKVDCVRTTQGNLDAVTDARRHIDIALEHLRAGTVRLVIVGGGPGTGKTSLSRALGEQVGAQVISTDDVRRQLQQTGAITGPAGDLDAGLYAPANVSAVYDEVLRRARLLVEQWFVGDLGRHLARCPPARACPQPWRASRDANSGIHLFGAA